MNVGQTEVSPISPIRADVIPSTPLCSRPTPFRVGAAPCSPAPPFMPTSSFSSALSSTYCLIRLAMSPSCRFRPCRSEGGGGSRVM